MTSGVDEAATTRRLARALGDPQTWRVFGDAARPGDIDNAIHVRRTHGAVLGFAGRRVLKIKRAVDLGFFDFRDAERRRFFCCEEVRLNRRLAADTYLGVSAIIETPDGELAADEPQEPESSRPTGERVDDGVVVDHAVAMVRLPDERMLAARLAAGDVADADLDRIARRLARFHAGARRDERVRTLAAPDRVRREFLENADQLLARLESDGPARRRTAATGACPISRVQRVRAWLDRTLAAWKPDLDRRITEGRACEGHGDLHAGNICLLDDTEDDVIAFDCIEFEEAFRCGDVAREMGFLAMDLEARGDAATADRLLASYAAAADDPELPSRVDPFIVHYALVRAKVAVITAADAAGAADADTGQSTDAADPPDATHPADTDDEAGRLEDLERYGEIAVLRTLPPIVVVMCGLPGTGKSHLGDAIAGRIRGTMLRSDVERKRLFGLRPQNRTPADRRQEVYGAKATRLTYDRLLVGATDAIRHGRNLVLDATFSRVDERRRTIDAIEQAGGIWAIVHADPPASIVRQWIAGRSDDPTNVSDADESVHDAARAEFEPPRELEASRVIVAAEPGTDVHTVPGRVIAALEAAATDPGAAPDPDPDPAAGTDRAGRADREDRSDPGSAS